MWACCRCHVVFCHCIVSGLAMPHSRILAQRVHTFALSKMSSRVYHTWRNVPRKKCVDVRFLWILSTFVLLHPLAFSFVPQSHFHSAGLQFRPLLNVLPSVPRLKNISTWRLVDVRFLSISCSFLLLHGLAFTYVPHTHFLSRGAYFHPI